MNSKMKNEIRSNARLIYGLTHILKDEVDELRLAANDTDLLGLYSIIKSTNETLEKIVDVVAEIEYMLYLDHLKES